MNKKRLIIVSTISIILVSLLFIGTTYSIFTSQDIDPNSNVYTTGNLDITYTLSSDNVKLTDATPVKDSEVEEIKPYRITVNNMGNVDYKFNVILNDTTATDSINYDYIMTQVGKLDPISLSSTTSNIIKSDIIVKAGTSVPIDIRVYLSSDIPNTELGKNFAAKLSIDGIAVSHDKGEVDNSNLIANYYYFGMPLSEVEPGSYVAYTGTNGCTGASCNGQNANYVDDTDMGYCYSSSYKFTVNGWRVGYISDDTAYLVSAGAPECLCTNSDGTTSSSECSSADSNGYHVTNINNSSLKYCNSNYAYGGICDDNSSWAMNDVDFEKITGIALSGSSCYASSNDTSCGYGNDLIDNSGYYWYALNITSNPKPGIIILNIFYWNPNNRYVSYRTSGVSYGVRPVLRLKSSVYVSGGSGTYEDPYTITTDVIDKNIEVDYTGNYQTFTAAKTGKYKIELWGAQGGSSYYNTDSTGSLIDGGKGGYTSGEISLSKGEKLYIYVGGKGENGVSGVESSGGYNGGGIGGAAYQGAGGGGGTTDVRLVKGNWDDRTSLNSRIMVAGGGGGSSNWTNAITGGIGGNLTGGTGSLNSGAVSHTLATGGTQTTGGTGGGSAGVGTNGEFGKGGNAGGGHGGGGGAGYYGGGGAGYIGGGVSSGAGGSSYISGYTGSVAVTSASDSTPKSGCTTGTSDVTCSYHYSGKKFVNAIMASGSESMPTHDGTSTMTGNSGNGYAKISYIS